MSLSEKYGYKTAPWKPPAIIEKHLKHLNDDSVLMDTDPNELILDAVSVAASKSNDIIMKDVVERVNPDENMELSQDTAAVNASEMAADSVNGFQTSQPLFDSDTEEFEFDLLSPREIVVEHPSKMEPQQSDANHRSQPLSYDNCEGLTKLPKHQSLQENSTGDTIDYSPIKKKANRLDSMPFKLQLTGNVEVDFATKLCRLKTTDEMIDYMQEQTIRVDHLMEELFSMR